MTGNIPIFYKNTSSWYQMSEASFPITVDLAHKLIIEQFPEFADLAVKSVEKQGHDNRTYRLGSDLLIRMPTEESYALNPGDFVFIEPGEIFFWEGNMTLHIACTPAFRIEQHVLV